MMDTPVILRDPYGVVLVIGSWNYPLHLAMLPAQAAIAAGNCVILKPSEVAPATAKLLNELIPRYLDQVRVTTVDQSTLVLYLIFLLGLLPSSHWRPCRRPGASEGAVRLHFLHWFY